MSWLVLHITFTLKNGRSHSFNQHPLSSSISSKRQLCTMNWRRRRAKRRKVIVMRKQALPLKLPSRGNSRFAYSRPAFPCKMGVIIFHFEINSLYNRCRMLYYFLAGLLTQVCTYKSFVDKQVSPDKVSNLCKLFCIFRLIVSYSTESLF